MQNAHKRDLHTLYIHVHTHRSRAKITQRPSTCARAGRRPVSRRSKGLSGALSALRLRASVSDVQAGGGGWFVQSSHERQKAGTHVALSGSITLSTRGPVYGSKYYTSGGSRRKRRRWRRRRRRWIRSNLTQEEIRHPEGPLLAS